MDYTQFTYKEGHVTVSNGHVTERRGHMTYLIELHHHSRGDELVREARQEEGRSSDSADLSVGHELRRGREGGEEGRGEKGVGREEK